MNYARKGKLLRSPKYVQLADEQCNKTDYSIAFLISDGRLLLDERHADFQQKMSLPSSKNFVAAIDGGLDNLIEQFDVLQTGCL
jgi:hypothetical protein